MMTKGLILFRELQFIQLFTSFLKVVNLMPKLKSKAPLNFISSVPDEITRYVFSFLDDASMVNAALVSKK